MLITSLSLHSEEVITLFLQPYPKFKTRKKLLSKAKKYALPGYLSKQAIKDVTRTDIVAGIPASYAGFVTISNFNGELTFPRKHEKPLVYVVITRKITPININDATIHHWEFEENTPAEMYRVEKEEDPATGIFYWQITPEEIPENKIIPLESIIIFASPHNVYVPTGTTLAEKGPHLILPDIYVKPAIKKSQNALYILYVRHFFGPMKQILKKEDKRRTTHLTY